MNKKIILYLSVFFAMLFTMCTNKTEQKPEVEVKNEIIEIDFDQLKDTIIRTSSVFKGVKLLPLETKDECLIGRINRLEIVNDTIYVLDAFVAKALYLFNINGKFIRKIGTVGKGPGEYVRPSDFVVYSNSNTISIYDSSTRKNILYNKKGELIREISFKNKGLPASIVTQKNVSYIDNVISGARNSSYCLITTDLDGNDTTNLFHTDKYARGFNKSIVYQAFYKYKNSIRYYRPFFDTVYNIKDNIISPYIILKNSNWITPKETELLCTSNNRMATSKRFLGISKYLETEKMIFMITKDYIPSFIFYWKDTQEIKYSNITNYKNEFFGRSSFPVVAYNNHLLGIGSKLIEQYENDQLNLPKVELEKVKNLTINSNPVLVLYECRDKFEPQPNKK